MIKTFTYSAVNCMLKLKWLQVSLACVQRLWRWHCLELSVSCYILLPTCGVSTVKITEQRLNVADNGGVKMLLKPPRWCSAIQIFFFVNVSVPTSASIWNVMYRCMCRFSISQNRMTLTNPELSSVRFTSRLWSHWCSSL